MLATTNILDCTYLLGLLLFSSVAVSQSTPIPPESSLLQTVYQFPNGTWVENLAVRSNGHILVTLLAPSPEIWEVDPASHQARHVVTFPNATSALGIAEYASDVFAINVGNFSYQTFTAETGSWSIWSLDMNGCDRSAGWSRRHYQCRHSLCGSTVTPGRYVIAVDSRDSTAYSIDTTSGDWDIAFDVEALSPQPDLPIISGANGVQSSSDQPDQLYWTNTFRGEHFGRIAIDPLTGQQNGPVEVLFRYNGSAQDDFTFDSNGNAWLVGVPDSSLIRLELANGTWTVIADDVEIMPGPTACKFGRSECDVRDRRLYVSTNGGLIYPLPQGIVGGAIIALDTASL